VRPTALCCLLLSFCAHLFWAEGVLAEAVRIDEASRRFPSEQRFIVLYLNGQDFHHRSLTFAVRREPGSRIARGTGYAGCNTWSARLDVSETGRLAVSDVATTRKFCHRDRMRTEGEFLAILRSLDRWRSDGRTLTLRGDRGTLVLMPASRTAALR